MQPLPTSPTSPEPDADTHPTRGRCACCGQQLQRLWMWEMGTWQADRWCQDCYDTTRTKEIARACAIVRARRAQPKEAA